MQAVVRAFQVLDALACSPNGVTVRGISSQLDMPKSVVGRILQALVQTGFSVQDAAGQRYLLGPRAAALGQAYTSRVDLMQAARPRMTDLRDTTEETVSLNVRIGRTRICVAQTESLHELRAAGRVGRTYPLDTGAPGRVLLAALSDDEVEYILEHRRGLRDYTPNRQLGVRDVWETVRAIRDGGVAVAQEETMRGVCSLAVPIRDHLAHTVGALAVLAPRDRFSRHLRERYTEALRAVSTAIEVALGQVAEYPTLVQDSPTNTQIGVV